QVASTTTVQVPLSGHDGDNDSIIIRGGQNNAHGNPSGDADVFAVTTPGGNVLVTEQGGPKVTLINSHRDNNTVTAVDGSGNPLFAGDSITILGGDGNDDMT